MEDADWEKINSKAMSAIGLTLAGDIVYDVIEEDSIADMCCSSTSINTSLFIPLSFKDSMANRLPVAFGPFGFYGPPRQWDDGIYSTVREVTIDSGEDSIYSIQVVYDSEGKPVTGKKYGEGSGTLKTKYGPYGKQEGTYFRTPLGAGKIVGFFGRYGTCLDAIGAYIKPFHEINSTTPLGPYGGAGGQQWDDGTYNTVRELIIYSGVDIDSIQVVYDDIEGNPVSGKKHGGDYGQPNTRQDWCPKTCNLWFIHIGNPFANLQCEPHIFLLLFFYCVLGLPIFVILPKFVLVIEILQVKLDYPTEYLLSISGHYGYNANKVLFVRSLTLQSNIKQYGPYGTENGIPFITPLAAGKIVGFFGRNGTSRLVLIGVHIQPFQTNVGPFGTTSGHLWDDGTYSMVRELIINSEEEIHSIQVVYHHDIEGNTILGAKHGGEGGTPNTVKLDSDEFLLSIWGYYGQVGNMVVIRSLGFQSNKRKLGPFGKEDGEKFQFPSTGGKIIGFHGRSHNYLTSIGAYVAPFPNLTPSLSSEDNHSNN
ncbi:jacalin-related lectin 32-like [Cornus florida]|uniref:jacalin-related lectin 32-like n=1 Tax=Cornus florida TaxID=4283 RepID=UPI002899E2B3|nr:jacalin-related lectin 32-like [Cornus florida]